MKTIFANLFLSINFSKYKLLWFVLFVFFCIFSSVSIVNHYYFRTYALDLGMFNHALYSFAHFRSNVFTLGTDGVEMNFLATHFSPIMALFVPFYYVFGSYALLFGQIAAVLFGAVGVFKLASYKFVNYKLSLLVTIQFLSVFGIYSAIAFDYHNNVVGAMLVPWFAYFFFKRNNKMQWFFAVLILLSHEIIAFWFGFVLLALAADIRFKFNKKEWVSFLSIIVLSVFYTTIIIGFVMPSLQQSATNLQLGKYAHLGNSMVDIILNLLKNPLQTIKLLFENTTTDSAYDYIKLELFWVVFFSGGIFVLFRKAYLIMLLPLFAIKLFSADYGMWGINNHYSIEIVPVISLALISSLAVFKKETLKFKISYIVLIFTVLTTFITLQSRKSKWYNATNAQFYKSVHYKSNYNIDNLNKVCNLIPENAKVSASSELVPRLAFRDTVYHFPVVKNAEFMALIKGNRSPYPLSVEEYESELQKFYNSEVFEVYFEAEDAVVFRRK